MKKILVIDIKPSQTLPARICTVDENGVVKGYSYTITDEQTIEQIEATINKKN